MYVCTYCTNYNVNEPDSANSGATVLEFRFMLDLNKDKKEEYVTKVSKMAESCQFKVVSVSASSVLGSQW